MRNNYPYPSNDGREQQQPSQSSGQMTSSESSSQHLPSQQHRPRSTRPRTVHPPPPPFPGRRTPSAVAEVHLRTLLVPAGSSSGSNANNISGPRTPASSIRVGTPSRVVSPLSPPNLVDEATGTGFHEPQNGTHGGSHDYDHDQEQQEKKQQQEKQQREQALVEDRELRAAPQSQPSPAGEPSGSESRLSARTTTTSVSYSNSSLRSTATPLAVANANAAPSRGILRSSTYSTRGSAVGATVGGGTGTSRSGSLDSFGDADLGLADYEEPLNDDGDRERAGNYSSRRRSSGGSVNSIKSVISADGLRSRSRSTSPIEQTHSHSHPHSHPTDPPRRGSSHVSIEISDHPADSPGKSSASNNSSTGVRVRYASQQPPPKSALKRMTSATSATIRRASGKDRLPLYKSRSEPLRYSQTSQQSSFPNNPHAHNHPGISPTPLTPSDLTHGFFLLVIIWVMIDSKAKVDRSTAQLLYYQEEEARVNIKITEFEARAHQMSIEGEKLRRDNEALAELKAEQLHKLETMQAEIGIVQAIEQDRQIILQRDAVIKNQVRILQQRIQTESRREVIDKFGPGPHRVELALQFPPAMTKVDANGRELSTEIHLEMASLDEMPHSVQLFLEQVHHGLWDGCAFVWNPEHLVLASPHVHAVPSEEEPGRYDMRKDGDKREDFVETGYTSVSFQEYSEQYPHKQYSLGYAGRPGGPNFYINLQDNSKVHGPEASKLLKGEDGVDDEDDGEADPCFARVVAGFETIDRLHAMPLKGEGVGWQQRAFQEHAFIRYAKILPS